MESLSRGSQFNHRIIHINVADWGLDQLLDLHNLLLKCDYYCNHSTSDRFFSDERGNEKISGALLISVQLVDCMKPAVCVLLFLS